MNKINLKWILNIFNIPNDFYDLKEDRDLDKLISLDV